MLIGVGGPAARIALMRQDVFTWRRWLTDEGFLVMAGVNSAWLAAGDALIGLALR
ncbi:MAG TPA: hypothetical protein VFP28_09965 [Gemmatimonadales bacterium]|nr:hypothetical protein [Gemmatimonadales bacterium]